MFTSAALGDRQDEQPLPPVTRADLLRADECRRNLVAHARKLPADFKSSEVKMVGDVFEKNESWPDGPDGPGGVGPEVPVVVGSLPAPSHGKGLAWVSASCDIHRSTPASSAEGLEVIPDRSAIQGLVLHPGHKSGRREGFPLDVANALVRKAEGGKGGLDPKLKPSSPGAEREPPKGT